MEDEKEDERRTFNVQRPTLKGREEIIKRLEPFLDCLVKPDHDEIASEDGGHSPPYQKGKEGEHKVRPYITIQGPNVDGVINWILAISKNGFVRAIEPLRNQ